MSHAEAIQKNNDVLLRCTTINLHVIDFLRAEDILDDAQESDLRAKKSHLKQCILLYQWLKEVSPDKYESFLQVMKDAEQEHVANLLTGSTEDEYLPLSDERHRRLVKIRHKMAYVTQIDSEVIAELKGAKAISMTDADDIKAEMADYAKVSKLIGSVMRRSNYSYNSFQEVLRKTLQKAAAEFLNEGEMPAVHVNNNRPDLDGRLSHAFNGVIKNRTTDDAEIKALLEEMNGLSLNPVKAIPEQSIVVFIFCKTVPSAVNFTQLVNSGRLQHILGSIFNRLLLTIEPHNTNTLDSRINLEDKEVVTLEEFTGIEGCMEEGFTRQKRSVEILRGCDATTQTDWMIASVKRQRPSGEMVLYECDAATQTGRKRRRRPRPRKRNKAKPNKCELSSFVYIDEDMGGMLQGLQDRRLTELEKPTSWPSIESSKESQLEKSTSWSIVLSSKTSQMDGWSQEIPKAKKPEVIKHTKQDQEFSMHAYKGKAGKLRDIQVRNKGYLHLQRKLERTEKEKDKLKKLLEHHTEIGDLPGKYKSDPVLLQTISMDAAEEKNTSISGLTILGQELFILCEYGSEIEVYDSMKFSFSRRWSLKELIDALAIVSCNRNNCLYIFDHKGNDQSNDILRVDPNGKLQKCWSTGGDCVHCLSVSSESNLILSVFDKNKLIEYSPDGVWIREINLSSDAGIRHPFHAVQLSNGDFVVSHGDDDQHTVCLVDATGKPKKALCEKCRLFIGQIISPAYLAIDRNGFVLVADRDNNRILLLDSDLEFKREILSKERHGLRYPERIFLDEPNGRLFVVENDWEEGRILIFHLK